MGFGFWREQAFWMSRPFSKMMKILEKHYFDVLYLECFLVFLEVMASRQLSLCIKLSWKLSAISLSLQSVSNEVIHPLLSLPQVLALLLLIQPIMCNNRVFFTYVFLFGPHDYLWDFYHYRHLTDENNWVPNILVNLFNRYDQAAFELCLILFHSRSILFVCFIISKL